LQVTETVREARYKMKLRMRRERQPRAEANSQGQNAEAVSPERDATLRESADARGGERTSYGEGEGEGAAPVPVGRERARMGGRRQRRASSAREFGASAAGTLGSGVVAIARLVMTVAVLIALLIALAIVLRDVEANGHNTIVKGIHEGANFFAGAFTDLISYNGHPKRAITVNWGIALVVYLIVGAVIASAISRVGHGGLRYERTHRPAI
jgi:hypothetical protein